MKRDINIWSSLCTKTRAYFANLQSRLLQRQQLQPGDDSRQAWVTMPARQQILQRDEMCYWAAKTSGLCMTPIGKSKTLFPAYVLFRRPTMLQQSVPYFGKFPPYCRSSWTLRYQCQNVQAQGLKSLGHGLDCLGTRTEMSWCQTVLRHFGTGAEVSCVRIVMGPMCL